jgi:hypothetical protein
LGACESCSFANGKDAWERRKEREKKAKKKMEEKLNALKLADKERTQKAHKEWLDTLTLTNEERKVAVSEVVMSEMLEFIEREPKSAFV